MATIPSPNMNLPVPIVGQEVGPQWSIDINACMSTLDVHDHSPGSGVMITPSGININSDLNANIQNIINLRSTRFSPQLSPLALPADIGAVYVSGVDLYYNDVNGVQIRLTQAGSIVGTAGSISGLVSPASASYVSVSSTFVFQSNVNTAANLDARSIILRTSAASSNGITLQVPAGLASDYNIVLPALPASLAVMSLDAAGNMGNVGYFDGSTIESTGTIIRVKAAGITDNELAANSVITSKIADNAVTAYKLSVDNIATAGSSGFATSIPTPTGATVVSGQTLNLTSLANRPIRISFEASMQGGVASYVEFTGGGLNYIILLKDSVTFAQYEILPGQRVSNGFAFMDLTPGDAVTHTYQIAIAATSGGGTATVSFMRLVAYQL